MSRLSPAAERIRNTANARIEEIARYFWGEPKERRRNALRYDDGLEIGIRGRHAGHFIVWGSTECGDGLSLIGHALKCDFPEALRFAAEFFGLPLDDRPMTAAERRRHEAEQQQRRRQAEDDAAQDHQQRIAKARAIWERAQ